MALAIGIDHQDLTSKIDAYTNFLTVARTRLGSEKVQVQQLLHNTIVGGDIVKLQLLQIANLFCRKCDLFERKVIEMGAAERGQFESDEITDLSQLEGCWKRTQEFIDVEIANKTTDLEGFNDQLNNNSDAEPLKKKVNEMVTKGNELYNLTENNSDLVSKDNELYLENAPLAREFYDLVNAFNKDQLSYISDEDKKIILLKFLERCDEAYGQKLLEQVKGRFWAKAANNSIEENWATNHIHKHSEKLMEAFKEIFGEFVLCCAKDEKWTDTLHWQVWKNAGEPQEENWGANHCLDDFDRLMNAVDAIISKKIEDASDSLDQLNRLYRHPLITPTNKKKIKSVVETKYKDTLEQFKDAPQEMILTKFSKKISEVRTALYTFVKTGFVTKEKYFTDLTKISDRYYDVAKSNEKKLLLPSE